MIKVLGIFKAPVPYTSDLFKLFSQNPDIELTVVFCIRTTNGLQYMDRTAGKMLDWGTNVLEGFEYKFLERRIRAGGDPDYKVINLNISKVIDFREYDVILMGTSYWSITTWIAIRQAKKVGIPIITRATVQTTKKRNKLLLFLKKLVVGSYCKRVDAGVYECQAQKNYLMEYGMQEEGLFYSPCAVNNEVFQNLASSFNKSEVRKDLSIPEDRVVICSTGQLISIKRPWDLIKAVEKLNVLGYPVELYLIGDGVLRKEIESYIDNNQLSSVHLTGTLSQTFVAKYLAICDIYAMASEIDASPKALNEAMNFALPIVVSTGVSTVPDLLEEGKNGYSFVTGDIEGLVNGIKRIIDNNCGKEMGQESYKIIQENGYDRVISGWMDAIDYVLSQHQLGNKDAG